jgi:VanZ family protein
MIVIGGLVEIFQYHLQWGREAEWADLAADAAGVLTAALFYKRF